jgi:DNA-binding transcriptional ArsR family regulator
MEEDAGRIAAVLKVLANENRLRILCELIRGPSAVGALGEKIGGISQSALSQQLALLKAHGMVADQRIGQSVTYFIADTRVAGLVEAIRREYCSQPSLKR